jgi:hypothetical protein
LPRCKSSEEKVNNSGDSPCCIAEVSEIHGEKKIRTDYCGVKPLYDTFLKKRGLTPSSTALTEHAWPVRKSVRDQDR